MTRYEGCIINGLQFRTKDRDTFRKSQNSDVIVKVDDETGNQDYYGVVTNIIQLAYFRDNNVFLFKCNW